MEQTLSDFETLSENSEASSIDDNAIDLLNYKFKYRKIKLKADFLERQLDGKNKLINALTDEVNCYKYSFFALSGGILVVSFYILHFFDRQPKMMII